jgi:quercetin dioxygenase-like cupin family protein/ketosteroid isomerase-like protein
VADHPNATRVRRALEARARGKFDEEDSKIILEAFADDAVWHMTGKSAWAADVKGKDQLLARWRMVAEASGGTFAVELHDLYADDEHAVGISTIRAARGDKKMEMPEIQVFHMTPEGKIKEFWGIAADEAARDAFWADDRDENTRLEDTRKALGLPALLTRKGTDGAMSLLKVDLPPGALLAPVHKHLNQDEASYVLEGELGFYLDGEVTKHRAGEFAFKPKGVPHTIFNDSKAPASFLELCWPGGLEEYLEEMAAALSTGGPPDFKVVAEIAQKYGIESDFSSMGELGKKYGVRQLGM